MMTARIMGNCFAFVVTKWARSAAESRAEAALSSAFDLVQTTLVDQPQLAAWFADKPDRGIRRPLLRPHPIP